MEEVWKDLSLTILQEWPTTQDGPKNATIKADNLHDFLSAPFKGPSTNPIDGDDISGFLGSGTASGPTSNSMGLHPHENSVRSIRSPSHRRRADPNHTSTAPSILSGSMVGPTSKKRISLFAGDSVDRRHKRLIKNRESAARSRARRQAYTNELEMELSHLMEENSKLRKQQQQLSSAASVQVLTKHPLYRTSTAPF
ncbi:protein FD-like [Magnolia sinica]|uniref:protein FD-like n=1 Tax=Magnolia sinica TaxID=86752 RepID=UPI0026589FF0|nr:protein FD-like [Magnolia sinica]